MASSSRLRKNPATLFDVFCEVGAGASSASDVASFGGADGNAPIVLQKYPEDYTNDAVLKSVRQFSFPCGLEDEQSEAVQLFSFVLTDSDSTYTFGFCRHTPKSNTCICILSALPWTTLFFKFLNHLAAVMNNGSQSDFDALLIRAYHTEIPNAGETFMVESSLGKNKLEVIAPDLNRLPTLRDDKYLLEYYNGLPEKQMLAVYASLLKERRVLFTGRKLSQLSSCIFAAAALIHPMNWQSIFIPVLPQNLTDMLMAPMPFLIGVPKKTLMRVRASDLAEVVIVDLENKSFQSPYDDLSDIPGEALQVLKSQLKSSADMFLSDGLARSFLRTTVLLFGGYRRGFVRRNDTDKITWDKHKFVNEQKPSLQPYLLSLIGTDGVQYLERFIEERLDAMNSGKVINDEFERELRNFEHRPTKTAQTVRENASDVFGALKDRVQGIAKDASAANLFPLLSGMNASSSSTPGRSLSSRMDAGIREKFGRLTPKEGRRTPSKNAIEIGLPAYDDSSLKNSAPVTIEMTNNPSSPSMLDDPQIQSFLRTDVVRRNGTNMHNDLGNRTTSLSGLESLERRQETDLIDWGVDAKEVEFDPLAARSTPFPPPGRVASPPIPRPHPTLSPTSNVDLLASVLTPPTSSSRSATDVNVLEEPQKPVSSLRQQWERFE